MTVRPAYCGYAPEFEHDIKSEARMKAFSTLRAAWNDRHEKDGLSTSDLADILGRDKSHVSRVLTGKHATITLETLAIFLEAMGYDFQIASRRCEDLRRTNHDARPQMFDPFQSPMPGASYSVITAPTRTMEPA